VFPDRPIGDFTAYRGRRHEDRDAFAKILETNRYDLRVAPHLADFCKGQEVNDAVKGANNEDKELFDLLNEQSYCHELHVRGHYPLQFYKLKEWLKPLWPREQAFEHIGQRFSFAWRIDDGHKKGLSAVLPFGYPAPLGGWLSLKFNINADGEGIKPTTWGTDLVYSPSASRFIDWYVVPVAWDRAFGTNGTSQFAQEAGMRFRFPVLKLPLRFYGGRIGLRNNALLGTSRNTRLVFELGGGSW